MTIASNYTFLNCACVNKFGTVIIVKNCFWLNINLNTVVKVPFTITYLKKSLMNTALSSIFITLQ